MEKCEVELPQEMLENALLGIREGASSKGIQVAFRHFMIKAGSKGIDVFSTDGSMLEQVHIAMNASMKISGEDVFLLEAEEFSKLVSSFGAGNKIKLITTENSIEFTCRSHQTKYRRRENEADEIVQFPTVKEFEAKKFFKYSIALNAILKKVAFAKEDIELNVRQYDLSGVFMKLNNLADGKVMVIAQATDQNKAASVKGTIQTTQQELPKNKTVEVYLGDRVVTEAVRIKASSLEVSEDGKVVILKSEDGVLIYWKVSSFKFPELSKTLDLQDTETFMMKVDKKEFLEVIARSGLLSDDERADFRNVSLKFSKTFLEKKEILISGEGVNIGKKFSDVIPVKVVEGQIVEVVATLNPDHLIDFLKAQSGSEIILKVRKSKDMIFLTTDEKDIFKDQDYIYVSTLME